MAIMAAALTGFTRADLDSLPDDGRRHELIDGAFFVTPSPGLAHQDLLLNLAFLLRNAAEGTGLHVVVAPFDVALSDSTVVEPDILVAPRDALTHKDLPTAPALAVEITSPSTARVDRLLKRDVYERAGVASYWLVDPKAPSVTVLELESGGYVERGSATGRQALPVSLPFPMELMPAAWLPAPH